MHRIDLIAKLRPFLIARRKNLHRSLQGELMVVSIHDDDSAEDQTFSQWSMTESHELAAIDEALERMRQGRYGECEECGAKIAIARLQALPYATTCISCQRQAERGSRVKQLLH